MKNSIVVLVTVLSLFACRQRTIVLAGDIDPEKDILATPQKSCYEYIKGRDTAMLSLKIIGKDASGDLTYNWFQKDKNKGTIEGKMRGDTIIANYSFTSEGKKSIRQVVFLKQDDKLIEGIGEIKLDGNKALYQDVSMLSFDKTIVMRKVSCD